MDDPLNLSAVLEWLARGGAIVVVTWALSWGLEEVAGWHNLAAKVRSLIILGCSIVVGVGSYILSLYPDVVAAIAPYFAAIMSSVVAWLGTQVAHKANPDR